MSDPTYVYHMLTEDGSAIVIQRRADGKFVFNVADELGNISDEYVFEAAEIVNMGNVAMVTAMAPPTFDVSTPERIEAYQEHLDQVTSGVDIDLTEPHPEDGPISVPNADGVEA